MELLWAQLKVRRQFWLKLVVYIVGAHGLFVIADTLLDQLAGRSLLRINSIDIDIPLLIGLGLVYLSTLLRRRKRTAWVVALVFYTFMIGFYAAGLQFLLVHHFYLDFVAKFVLPIVIIALLALLHQNFTVKSDIQSFRYSLRFTVIMFLVAFIYGTAGYSLMDMHDFRKEITVGEAMHRTIDQFGLTTNSSIQPHTRRAHVFVDSLSVVSVAAVGYAVISLFQPIRWRYTNHKDDHTLAEQLLANGGKSEDFFKLWPHDKHYVFNKSRESGIAYHVARGVALAVGDPMGPQSKAKGALDAFEDMCYGNDWLPVLVHTEPTWNAFYHRHGYVSQKIGEEAILHLDHFIANVKGQKYFRQINNKFTREGYTTEVLVPPHSKAVISRLRVISDAWLERPGRAERQLVMGYFTDEYMQQCNILVARDAAGTIQGFINQVLSFDPHEANFDMLRHSHESLGNINDFLLMGFIDHLHADGMQRLNLGLCPLAGLDDIEDKSVITKALEFVYSNGDRFYSFSGLTKFKAKYEPEWSDRFVVYKGGVRNFVRAMNALTRAMRVKQTKSPR